MQYRHALFVLTLAQLAATRAYNLFSQARLISILRKVEWQPTTPMVVVLTEFSTCSADHDVRALAAFAELLEQMSHARQELVAAASSRALTTQWQTLPNGAKLATMTGMMVGVHTTKHSAIAMLCLMRNLFVRRDLTDKWSRVFQAASGGLKAVMAHHAALTKLQIEQTRLQTENRNLRNSRNHLQTELGAFRMQSFIHAARHPQLCICWYPTPVWLWYKHLAEQIELLEKSAP